MNKIHATVVALILGASGALGVAAATHTTALRTPAAGGVSDSAIAARTKQLDKVQRQIARAGRDKPPALPAVPASRSSSQPPPPHVVYRRPPPLVLVSNSGHHESDDENEHEGDDD